jgi:hypothetical protein
MTTPPREPSEEEMRAAYEAELKRISTADVILQTAVSLINLAGRRLGRVPGAEDERDLEQVRDAIDAVRGLMPVLERTVGPEIGPLREALSQLQMAYAREAQVEPAARGEAAAQGGPEAADAAAGATAEGKDGDPDAPGEEGPGPAQSSGRLWIPGQ